MKVNLSESKPNNLSDEFKKSYEQFATQFDQICEDLFEGPKAEKLVKQFLESHADELTGIQFVIESKFSIKQNSNNNETLDEDLLLLRSGLDGNARIESSEQNKLIGDLYSRACQACYLRITLNKSRLNQEEDRREAINLGRLAIRHDPNSFRVCYWFMIAIGWQLDGMTNALEKTLVARVFQQSAKRCIQLKSDDGLAYNLLGRYYYNVAQLSWLERTVAKGITGLKYDHSYADSESQILKCHEINPVWLPTGLWMAKVKLAQKRPIEEVKKWIDFGLALDCKEPSSELERVELIELKSKLKLRD